MIIKWSQLKTCIYIYISQFCKTFLWHNQRGILRKRDHFGDPCIDGRIVLLVIKQGGGDGVGRHRQDRDKRWTHVNKVWTFMFHIIQWNLLAVGPLPFQERICSMELDSSYHCARLASGSKMHWMFSLTAGINFYSTSYICFVVVTADSCIFCKYEKSEWTCMCTLTTYKLTAQPSLVVYLYVFFQKCN